MNRTAKNVYLATQIALFCGAVAAAIVESKPDQWSSPQLLVLLLVLTLAGDRLAVNVGSQVLTASFIALVLAMTLLGPGPAAACGVATIAVDTAARRPPIATAIANFAAYSVYPVVGGLLTLLVLGDVHNPAQHGDITGATFALLVFGVFIATNLLNFALVATEKRVLFGRRLWSQLRDLLVPLLPGQFAAAVLASILAVAYTNLGYSVLVGVVAVILIFQYLAVALLRSEDRAEQLAGRSRQLATLQVGVLSTLMETLNLRDPMTARHAAAVARFARDLARAFGCTDEEQDLVHTAGLLHDIGKFAFPDRILKSKRLSDQDWAIVRRHPQDGAALVGRLDGYGPVSDVILYHHERIDGTGYPAGLIGKEIPLLSRIVAVCETYDVLTARDSYRQPVTPRDALAELRRVSDRQLDGELVELFIAMLEANGPVTSAAGDDADFEQELDFERRARTLAQPAIS